jgi:hypothetical protein
MTDASTNTLLHEPRALLTPDGNPRFTHSPSVNGMSSTLRSLCARPAASGQPLRASRAARPAARSATVTRAGEKKEFDMFKLAGGRGLDMGEVRPLRNTRGAGCRCTMPIGGLTAS